MRILYSFPDLLGAPGIGETALQQVRSLARRDDVEVHVAATALAADPGTPATCTLAVGGRRVPHRLLGRDRAGSLRAYELHDRRVARLLERRPGVDAVHVWPRATLHTARRAARLGIPVLRQAPSTHTAHAVETVRAAHAELGLPLPRDNVHGHSPELVARELAEYAAADRILVPSEHAAGTFVARGVDPARLARHRFGCDLDRFRPGPRAAGGGLTALFVGRGEPAKGLHLALRAWSRAGVDGRLIVCGAVDPGLRARIGDLLAAPGVEERGVVADPAPLMARADVLVLPSLNEGSALVTYEAQAAGCVPVVSDACGAPAEHRVHGLIHPAGDLEALTRHLRLLASDRDLLEALRARTLADRDRLSWDAAAPGLVAAYAAAIGRPAGEPALAR